MISFFIGLVVAGMYGIPLSERKQTPVKKIESLTLSMAIERTLKNYPKLVAQSYEVERNQSMKGTVVDLGKTYFEVKFGNYNGYNQDLGFEIRQKFAFPTYYTVKSGLAQAKLTASKMRLNMTKQDLIFRLKAVWNHLRYLQEVQALKKETVTLLSQVSEVSLHRYERGEGTYLEKSLADMQKKEAENELLQTRLDYQGWYRELQYYLHTHDSLDLQQEDFKPNYLSEIDTASLQHNPTLLHSIQQVLIARQAKHLEEHSLVPDFYIGYVNQSSVGAIDRQTSNVADFSTRFSSFYIGISIPLFFWAGTSKIDALENERKAAVQKAIDVKSKLYLDYDLAQQAYQKQKLNVTYYNNDAMIQAQAILETAKKEFEVGSIGYLEYFQSLSQAMKIRSKYIKAVHELNLATLRVEFLLTPTIKE